MSPAYYGFALFIAALVCIVAIVFRVLFFNVKKQNEMLDEREKEMLRYYNAVETIMEEFQDQAKATIDELKLREGEYRAAMANMAAFQLPPEVEKKEQTIEKIPRVTGLDAGRIKAATDVIERAEHMMSPENVSTVPAPMHREPAVTHAPAAVTMTPAHITPAASPKPAAHHEPATPEIFSTPATKPVFQSFFDDAMDAPPPTPYAPVSVNGGSRKDEIMALAYEGKTDVEIASQLGITRNEVQLVIGLMK